MSKLLEIIDRRIAEIGGQYERHHDYWAERALKLLNEVRAELAAELGNAPIVHSNGGEVWIAYPDAELLDTHAARLIDIQPIEKKE